MPQKCHCFILDWQYIILIIFMQNTYGIIEMARMFTTKSSIIDISIYGIFGISPRHDSLVNELDVVKEVHEIWETKCFQTFLTCISENNNWAVVNGFSVKTSSTQIMHIYNLGHNILRLFDVLPNFPFTTGETNRDY